MRRRPQQHFDSGKDLFSAGVFVWSPSAMNEMERAALEAKSESWRRALVARKQAESAAGAIIPGSAAWAKADTGLVRAPTQLWGKAGARGPRLAHEMIEAQDQDITEVSRLIP